MHKMNLGNRRTKMIQLVTMMVFLLAVTNKGISQHTRLVAYWKLLGDAKNHAGKGNDGINHGVEFPGGSGAMFNGENSYIEIPSSASLAFGKDNFSISAWVKCAPGARVGGDIVNKFDTDSRTGFNFHILSSSSAYNAVSDSRNVFFGVDQARNGKWIEEGLPVRTNNEITLFVVFKNHLYAGISATLDPEKSCRLFRYEGPNKWKDCGRISKDLNTPSAMTAVIHKGSLYIGTGKWDYMDQENAGMAAVYKYDGDTSWSQVGTFPLGKKRIHTLASFNQTLYCSDDTGETYRYDESDNKWVLIHKLDRYKFISSGVYRDQLFCGSSNSIYAVDKNDHWNKLGAFNAMEINQVHTLETYQGMLYAGTWPDGIILRYDKDTSWTPCGIVGVQDQSYYTLETTPRLPYKSHKNEIQELAVYNGKMYCGVIPKGEVWRYDGGQKTTLITRLVHNDKYSIDKHETWCRVPTMAVYKGKLFAGTGTARGFPTADQPIETGRVYSWQTGAGVSLDDDIGTDWRNIVVVRENGRLKIYMDGKLQSSSSNDASSMNINNKSPFLIGFGQQNYFKGNIKEIKVYHGALTASQVATLYAQP